MFTPVIVLLIIWMVGITAIALITAIRLRGMLGGIKKKELRELLEHVSQELSEQQEKAAAFQAELERLLQHEETHLQKVGFVRFNPFADTGGNQSFCIAILDRHDNGIVISSLHSRDQTRLYAKQIRERKAQGQQLSKEENEAVKRAQSNLPLSMRSSI